MTGPPIVEIQGVIKAYPALRPLRLEELVVSGADRLVLRGLDAGAAEMFVHLVTGAALPDEGTVRVSGRDTREIATDTEWLTFLDRFGIVTHRAVLIDKLPVAANLALPLTLSIDPMPDAVRSQVAGLAAGVGLASDCLDRPVAELDDVGRLQLHLARAIANRPAMVMLEHPTSQLDARDASARFGQALRSVSDARGFGWIALSEDQAFADASGGRVMVLDAASGRLSSAGKGWRRWLRKVKGD
jgi:ABC-type transporter Mla maintaining outer membrane lipid asymmetry ATPase subunit MlaF